MSQEFENEHPRDDDGQFEKKRWRRQSEYHRTRKGGAARGGWGIGKKQYDDWVTFVDKVLELTDKYDLWDYSDEDEEG